MDKLQVAQFGTLLCSIVPKSFVRSTDFRIPKESCCTKWFLDFEATTQYPI